MQIDVVGLSIGIAGILTGIMASYYFYRKSIRVKEPCWAIRSNNLIRGYSAQLDHLKVLYKSEDVENLTISRVLFWNDGEETIDRQHIETVNPLRIIPSDKTKLLDAKILAINNQSSQLAIRLPDDGKCAYLEFDYLDQKQGAVIQVVHTGTSSKDIHVVGDIKGVKSLRNRGVIPTWIRMLQISRYSPKPSKKFVSLLAIFSGLVYLAFAPISLFAVSLQFLPAPRISPSQPSLSQFISFVLFITGGFLMLILGLQLWRRLGLAPKGLEIFNEELS